MMKAFIVDRYGSKDGVRAGDMPEPELREDDVLVQIHAAGVNLLDAKIRDGEFKRFLPYRFPLILGNEVAGVVVRVGSRVQRFKPGDEVYARPDDDRIGAFAECIAMQEDAVAKKPTNLTMEEAASIPLVGLTAWQVLVERAKLSARAKSAHPRGLRWGRNRCHSAGQASWCDRRDDHEHGESRVGEAPGCRSGHRLPERRFRTHPAGLRCGVE